MKRPWLVTPTGMTFTALGIVAVGIGLSVFAFGDVFTLREGNLMSFGFRGFLYMPLAMFAAIFAAFTFFTWRPWLPRIIMALFGLAMASHIAERFVTLAPPFLRWLASIRLLISLGVVGLVVWHRFVRQSDASSAD